MIAMQSRGGLGDTIYEPTPKDIRQACEQLQATWSPQNGPNGIKGRVRRGGTRRPFGWPGLLEAVNEEGADSPPY